MWIESSTKTVIMVQVGKLRHTGSVKTQDLNGQGQIAANGETAPKPTENDGWSYIGQNAEGMENYQTVYTPPSAGMITASQASFLFVMAAVDGPAPIGDGLAIVAGAGFVAYNMSHGNKSDPLKALAMMRGDSVSSPGSPMPDPDDEQNNDGRPNGVPKNWVKEKAKKDGHIKWVNPKNPHDYVRVKPNGEMTQVRNGMAYDQYGNRVALRSPEAHGITRDNFIFRK